MDLRQLQYFLKVLEAGSFTSAAVLLGLPIIMLILLSILNPTYPQTFFGTVAGWIMLSAAGLQLGVGAFWLSRIIKPRY